jgi:hypothetical protein
LQQSDDKDFPIHPESKKQMLHLEVDDIDILNDALNLGGSQMIVHNVDEYPFEDKNAFILMDETVTTLALEPTVIEADDTLRSTTLEE